jgi:hypothetical protein
VNISMIFSASALPIRIAWASPISFWLSYSHSSVISTLHEDINQWVIT